MLNVWASSILSGRVDRLPAGHGAFGFAYDPQAAEQQAVSLTMPLSLTGYEYPYGLHPIFQMNLPEGHLREVLERRFRKTVVGFDDLSLLQIVGPAQIGRLRYGEDPTKAPMPPLQSVGEILAYEGAEDLFADLVNRFASSSGVSGVQPKVLVRDEAAWSISGDGRRSLTVRGATHLVKAWDADEYAELAANEYFCMRVAAKTGLSVARCELSNNGRLLVVERFDLDESGQYMGFEDACVLQGLPVSAKYDGSYEGLAKTLRLFVAPQFRGETLAALFKTLALSCALRNGDAHLKNFGVLYADPDSPVRFAPVYDIVTTAAYFPNDTLALTLDGRKSWPSAKVLLQFARMHCGLEPAAAVQVLAEIADAITDVRPALLAYGKERPSFKEMAITLHRIWQEGVKKSLIPS